MANRTLMKLIINFGHHKIVSYYNPNTSYNKTLPRGIEYAQLKIYIAYCYKMQCIITEEHKRL